MGNLKNAVNNVIEPSHQIGDGTTVYESTALECYPTKEEMYAAAELVAFEDMLHAGYAAQAIRNTTGLAQIAIEPMRRLPEFESQFKDLVRAYVCYAADKILGGQA